MSSSSDQFAVRCTLTFDGDTVIVVPTRTVSTALGLADHPQLPDDRLRDVAHITVQLLDGKLFSFQAYLDLAKLARRHRRLRPTADRVLIVTDTPIGLMRQCASTLGVLDVLSIEPSPLTRAPRRRRPSRSTGKE